MVSAAQSAQFPPALETVPEEARLPENFGWTPAVLGAAAAGLGVFFLATVLQGQHDNLAAAGLLLALGGVLLHWEYRRRARRTVLVPQGAAIGVYRKGALDVVLAPSQITYYQLNWFNTIRYLVLPLAGIGGVISAAMGDKPNDATTWLLIGVAAVVCLLLVGLVVHTRIMLKHFYIPRRKGRAEKVLLTREQAAKIYAGQLQGAW